LKTLHEILKKRWGICNSNSRSSWPEDEDGKYGKVQSVRFQNNNHFPPILPNVSSLLLNQLSNPSSHPNTATMKSIWNCLHTQHRHPHPPAVVRALHSGLRKQRPAREQTP
jgi:hypothetical protein